ncbi:alanine racemase [Lyngbya confervoides]|uniref:Alanine racemase n=1 Tax=Lyngbya confervoides BDU141951 TaxID=1574623 RepID=A0ABD4T4D8_9CYAN|nr:alanine racemase [Lyngbya confervoides]MCM1983200.1 alanine racemase [Lyngbya confervoides BDU141951]
MQPTWPIMSDAKGKQKLEALAQERAWIALDRSALLHNIQQVQAKLAPGTKLIAVVKADAYGHGAIAVARLALSQGVAALAVATIPEGIQLRQSGITAPILVLGATYRPEEITAIAQWRLQPTLCSPEQALNFSRQMPRPLQVHLNIDTGMSRLGPIWQQGEAFVKFVQGLANLEIVGVYSHLATADDPHSEFTALQLARFQELAQKLKVCGMQHVSFHLANSAGVMLGQVYHFDWVRVGLALYGLYPHPSFYPALHLRPVMAVKAKIKQVKLLPTATGVSYGHTFVTDRPTLLAVVGIGYGDGVPRSLSNRMQVLVQGQRVPQIGNVTMDQLMIDVTQVPQVQVGDEVTLIGRDGDQGIRVEDWAHLLQTISYEIVCGFRDRLPRCWI